MDYVPHTEAEIASMLGDIGLASLDDLWEAIPEALRLATGDFDVRPGLSEPDTLAEVERLAAANQSLLCFAGGGAHDHEVPATVRRLAFRSEFVTAYTPYQPEVAQGVLQALFEYQTLLCRLTGMEVANASLYDGATALVEAVNLGVAASGNQRVWVSDRVNPQWVDVVRTFAAGTGHQLEIGATPPDGVGVVVVQSPDYYGVVGQDITAPDGAKTVAVFDPVALGLLRPPVADVAVGEGQPFGTPLSFGGPYLGLFATHMEHVRRLPGRLVGETVDTEGRRAYVTTLRTREQDIRREKASSNVCTNQTLIAVAWAIQLSWLGTSGLRDLALRCARGTRYTREATLAIDGIDAWSDAPVFREFAVRLPINATAVIERMAEEGFLAGTAIGEDAMLIAVTERRTRDEIDRYVATLQKVIS
ncbi:MAG TPA: aminomethyl-transferring glycine dehydrogenase subunit GcvPA [Acidimicrobiales bacterium]|nr:aminomethyl-transferring glycine dehydrogenase subunit GcvPA [Acidimicrobiales bacterium]